MKIEEAKAQLTRIMYDLVNYPVAGSKLKLALEIALRLMEVWPLVLEMGTEDDMLRFVAAQEKFKRWLRDNPMPGARSDL